MKGVLLVNTGSPKSNNPKDLEKFQEEVLKDKRVIDPAHGIPELTPLEIADYQGLEYPAFQKTSKSFLEKVKSKTNIPVALAMGYGNPTIKSSLQALIKQGVTELLVMPLFPQYAFTTNEAVNDKIEKIVTDEFPQLDIKFFLSFYNHSDYIKAVSDTISEALNGVDYDHILFSYHGVPEHFSMKRDVTKNQCMLNGYCCARSEKEPQFCYKTQCFESSKLIASKLNLETDAFSTSFQSRIGLEPWLQPTTKRTIERLASEGVKKLVMVFPGYVSDCHDTLKMAAEGKERFLNKGGEEFIVVPCLNDRDEWAEAVTRWIDRWRIVDLETAIA